jgi:hypothetical protein
MRKPRGFGKNYFKLSAILAYSVTPRLESLVVQATETFSKRYSVDESIEEEETPPDFFLTQPILQSAKPCYCNKIFKVRIRLILLLNHFIPRCVYYTVCFAFRRTGVHPPYSI